MSEIDARDQTGSGAAEPDDVMSPELRRAVVILRQLPPTAPGAVARVVAAAAADRRASIGGARRRGVRLWSAGALAAVAAGLALLVVGGRGRWTETSRPGSDTSPGARYSDARRSAPVPVVRAVGNTRDAALGDVRAGDASRSVTFVLQRPSARTVAVVGDFNQWDARATPLVRHPDGGWAVTVPLAPGRHAYRFVVDDSLRVLDPSAPAERDADLGVARSIVVVGVP